MMLRFDSNPWSEPTHTLLTASARFAQRAGVYAFARVVLTLFVAMTGMTGIMLAHTAIARDFA